MLGRDPKELNDEQMTNSANASRGWGSPPTARATRTFARSWSSSGVLPRPGTDDRRASGDDDPQTASRAGQWRILVGEDASLLDQMVREAPLDAYEPSFLDRLHAKGVFQFTP